MTDLLDRYKQIVEKTESLGLIQLIRDDKTPIHYYFKDSIYYSQPSLKRLRFWIPEDDEERCILEDALTLAEQERSLPPVILTVQDLPYVHGFTHSYKKWRKMSFNVMVVNSSLAGDMLRFVLGCDIGFRSKQAEHYLKTHDFRYGNSKNMEGLLHISNWFAYKLCNHKSQDWLAQRLAVKLDLEKSEKLMAEINQEIANQDAE